MKKLVCCSWLVMLILVQQTFGADQSRPVSLKQAAPTDAYLVVYGMHNPERDFQRAYYQEIMDTVKETKIVERVIEIVTAQMAEEDLAKAKSVFEEIRTAVAPIDWEAFTDCQEVMYAQRMHFSAEQRMPPVAQHLALFRVTPKEAAAAEQAVRNLLALLQKYSEGKVQVQTAKEGDAQLTWIVVPPQVPFQPTFARVGDVVMISSSEQMTRQSLAVLSGETSAASKFDDPRLQSALSKLPEAEDSIVFFDGKQLFGQLGKMGQFIRTVAAGDENAERVAGLIDEVFAEVSIIDFEATVEYTDENRNCKATYGKLLPDVEDKVLTQVVSGGQPFEHWSSWVPADALSYSLSTGANLHPLYVKAMEVIDERFPEAKEGLQQFEALQQMFDVHLDRDILQAFTGGSVSVSMPSSTPAAFGGGQDSVTALRCQKPDRIRELLHRGFTKLQEIPQLQAQGFKVTESEELEGFDEVSLSMLAAFGVRPVIGFRDGWMMIGSSPKAVQRVLSVKAGEGDTIEQSEGFKKFQMEIEGPVRSVSYTNLAESTRRGAATIRQIGAFAPAMFGMMGAQANEEWAKQVQELLGLLPSLAQIVEKFDFLEAKLSVTQSASEPGAYLKRVVTLVRAEQ